MADENRNNDDGKKGGEFRVPPRTWIVWIAIFGGIISLMMLKEKIDSQGELLSQAQFYDKVNSTNIASATIKYSAQSSYLTVIEGKYFATDAEGNRLKENGRDKEVA